MRLTEKRQTVGVAARSAGKSTAYVSSSAPLPSTSSDATQYRARGPLSLVLILVQQTVYCRRRSSDGGVCRHIATFHFAGWSSLRSHPDRSAVSYRSRCALSLMELGQLTPNQTSLKFRKVKFTACPMALAPRCARSPRDVRILLNIPWALEGTPRFHGGRPSRRIQLKIVTKNPCLFAVGREIAGIQMALREHYNSVDSQNLCNFVNFVLL